MNFTKNTKQGYLLKLAAVAVLSLVTLFSFFAAQHITHLKTHYSASQFQPESHQLLERDDKIRELYNIQNSSPHILLLRLSKGKSWLDSEHFEQLNKLSQALEESKYVEKIVSITNVPTAVVEENSFYTGTISEMLQTDTDKKSILDNTLLSPQLISKNGRSTIIVVTPKNMSIDNHTKLVNQLTTLASVYLPTAKAHVGGPAAIRTEVSNLLSKEILLFVTLSLLGAIFILFFVFKGWVALPTTLFIVVIGNIVSLGTMAFLGFTFTVLSTTVPILVTITIVAISTHSMVRIGEEEEPNNENRYNLILKTMKELGGPHVLTAITTMVGFGTLIFSNVPLIQQYGKIVSIVVPLAAILTLISLPAILFIAPLPETRSWLKTKNKFANFVMYYRWPLFISVLSSFLVLSFIGRDLQWTSRMFDDLPKNHNARRATEYISRKQGGIIPLEVSIRSMNNKAMWKNIDNVNKLDHLTTKWRKYPGVGSVVSLTDFIKVADYNKKLPKKSNSLSEIYLVYGMGQINPLRQYMTANNQGTRITIKFKDIPANKMQNVIRNIESDLQLAFANEEIIIGGLAATIHPLNEILSKNLMFGFFHAMLGILLLLSIIFKSWKWAIVSSLPNLVPPIVLLGTLAITKTPIKPSIAIIFAISLGIAFDNTVYILGRLKEMLRERVYNHLPVKDLLSHEAAPCFVSSMSLFAGFSIFLFSYFNMNKVFGIFMLLSIVAGLIGDLILLPSVLKIFPRLLFTPQNELELSGNTFQRSRIMNTTFTLVITGLLSVFLYSQELNAKAQLNADKLLNKVQSLTSPPNETVEVQMNIIEPDGSKKLRSLTIKRKNSNAQKALIKITEPTDLKGVSLLSISEGKSEDQWLYLPSTKRARRIVGSGKKGRFLDSELSYEDMSVTTYNSFTNKVLKMIGKGKSQVAVIESKAKNNSDSSYAKIHTYISLTHNRIEKVEYLDKRNKVVKIMNFSKYRKVGKKYWRAGIIKVVNKADKRSTILELKNVSLKKLDDDQFTTAALE
ncbi:MAG: outer membrane lipoprotein-sorting protein [Bdellovibrionales bacterium]|nr:outer membrane lipoprotein-sorting protein [Bdellovibrionales bacterium]